MKLLKQLESGFKIINNKNKYQSKLTGQAQIRYLEYLIDPSFQRVNRFFVLSFGNRADTVYFQGGDYTTGCLLDYIYFKEHYKLIAMELNKMLIQKQYKKLILLET